MRITVVATDITVDEYYAIGEALANQDVRGLLKLLQRFVAEDISNPQLSEVAGIADKILAELKRAADETYYRRKEFGE